MRRNLKKVMTLALALAMTASLTVASAGAFNDQDDINNTAAVDKMVALNIINGRDDGSFDPTGKVTRAEMAKMITVALNGGQDPKYSDAVSSYTDTKGHWAAGYIEYCTNMGIIAGMGEGLFAPDAAVTATQASKMLLSALGYDAEYEGFVGEDWALNTNKVATQKGLYQSVVVDPNAPLSRDNAAQMISNFTEAAMVKYEFGISGTGGNVSGVKQAVDATYLAGATTKVETVLHKFYKLIETETDNLTLGGQQMTAVSFDSNTGLYAYTIDNAKVPGTNNNVGTVYSENDYSALLGQDIVVMFKDKDSNNAYNKNTDSVYDILNDGSAVIAEGPMTGLGKLDTTANELKFDGTTYDIDTSLLNNAGKVAFNDATAVRDIMPDAKGNATVVTAANTLANALTDPYYITLIDRDGNGKIDAFTAQPLKIQKVAYVGTDAVTFAGQGDNTVNRTLSNPTVKLADMDVYEDIAKDDIVAVYAKNNVPESVMTVQKLDKVSATVTEVRESTKEVKIDGAWYDNKSGTSVKAGDTIDFVNFGSFIYFAKVTEAEATSRNLLAVYDTAVKTQSGLNKGKVEANVMLAQDGSKQTIVTIAKVNGVEKALPTVGQMYSYKINSDKEYELMPLNANNMAGHDGVIAYNTKANGDAYKSKKIDGKMIADDAAIIIVSEQDNSAKFLTGAELVRNQGDLALGNDLTAVIDEVNGFKYVTAATISIDGKMPIISTGLVYGYMLKDGSTSVSSETGKRIHNYIIWTTEGEKPVFAEDTATDNPMKKGDLISYNVVEDNEVKDVTKVKVGTAVGEYRMTNVTGWDESKPKQISLGGKDYDMDDNTQIMNVKTADHEGVPGKTIIINEVNNNAYVIFNTDGKVDFILVDLSAKIATVGNVAPTAAELAAATSNTGFTNLFNDKQGVSLTTAQLTTIMAYGGVTSLNVPADKTLEIVGDTTLADPIVLANGAKLEVTGTLTAAAANTITKAVATDTTSVVAKEIVGLGYITATNITAEKVTAAGQAKTLAAGETLTLKTEKTALHADSTSALGQNLTVAAGATLNVGANTALSVTNLTVNGTVTMDGNVTATITTLGAGVNVAIPTGVTFTAGELTQTSALPAAGTQGSKVAGEGTLVATLDTNSTIYAATATNNNIDVKNVKLTGGPSNQLGASKVLPQHYKLELAGDFSGTDSDITVSINAELTISGTAKLKGLTQNYGTVKVTGTDVTIGTLTASASNISVAAGAKLTVTNAAPNAALQKISGVATSVLDVKAASTDSAYSTTTGVKFFDNNGMETTSGGNIALKTYNWDETAGGWKETT